MNEEKVVKCDNEGCGLHFGYSQENTKCPFCATPHKVSDEVIEEKTVEKPKEKKLIIKTQKESFKVWKE